METAKSSSGWVGATALALGLLMACLDGEPGSDGKTWTGSIRNACGRADGPAVALRLGAEADTACPGLEAGGQGAWRLLLEGHRIETLKPGTRLEDSLIDCDPYSCEYRGRLRILVLKNGPEAVIGAYEFTQGRGDTARVQSGPAYLKKCPMIEGMCG